MLVVVAIGAWEWSAFISFKTLLKRSSYVVSTVLLITILWFFMPPADLWLLLGGLQEYAYLLLWLSVAWWLLATFLIFSYPKSTAVWARSPLIIAIFGWCTLIPTWLAFMVLRSHNHVVDAFHGAQLLMFLFLLVWSADVGAYFVGKAFGKRKLMPNVSPGKTLEGFIGGVVCASLLTFCIGYYMGWSAMQFINALFVAVLISSVSVLGDLTESMFKRQAGIKDSGKILPGHGGILDRIDSLTATAPVFALCYLLLDWA
jgi:phosphatidate cytidylyltransferase